VSTREDFIATYGDVPLTFSSYYKYTFEFTGSASDGARVTASVGGNSDDIYRYEASRDSVITVRDGDMVYAAYAYIDGKEVASFYDY
jgi:hypothetical protein